MEILGRAGDVLALSKAAENRDDGRGGLSEKS